jgi:SNF2 family DNA or RNA helicase
MKMKKKARRRYYRRPSRIAPSAVRAFMDRELEDFRWMKKVEYEKLARETDLTLVATRPRHHQLVSLLLAQNEPRWLYFLDMGAGKTKIVLDAITYRKRTGELKAALVCVPFLINLESWVMQAKLHAPGLRVVVLEGSRQQRLDLLNNSDADLYVINYAGLLVYMTQQTRGAGRMMVPEQVEDFCSLFNFVCFDEVHLMGDHKSLTFELCHRLSQAADFCYALTGTPFNRDPQKLWSVFNVVDGGETLGKTLAVFRAAFFKEEPNYWSGIEYVFDRRKQLLLHRMIQHRSIRYAEHELGEMPKAQEIPIHVRLTQEQEEYYHRITAPIRESGGDQEELKNVYHRWRQTTSGFIAVRAEDTVRIETQFEKNAKMDALFELLDEIGPEEKVVIFHYYIYSGVMISQQLKARKIRFSGVGHGFDDPRAQFKKFIGDPKCRIFLANAGAGGTGVDGLQEVCHFGVFYETPSSPSTRKQCVKRLARPGQKHKVRFYDLVGTLRRGQAVDVRILEYLKEGKDLFEAVCEGKVKL